LNDHGWRPNKLMRIFSANSCDKCTLQFPTFPNEHWSFSVKFDVWYCSNSPRFQKTDKQRPHKLWMASKGKKVKVTIDGKTLPFLITDFTSLETKVKARWKIDNDITFYTKDGEELGDIDLLEENDELVAIVDGAPQKETKSEQKKEPNDPQPEDFTNKPESPNSIAPQERQKYDQKESKKEKMEKMEIEDKPEHNPHRNYDAVNQIAKVDDKTQSVANPQEIADSYCALLVI
jgi:hypothetical protein